jgi:hypothetical protein
MSTSCFNNTKRKRMVLTGKAINTYSQEATNWNRVRSTGYLVRLLPHCFLGNAKTVRRLDRAVNSSHQPLVAQSFLIS